MATLRLKSTLSSKSTKTNNKKNKEKENITRIYYNLSYFNFADTRYKRDITKQNRTSTTNLYKLPTNQTKEFQ